MSGVQTVLTQGSVDEVCRNHECLSRTPGWVGFDFSSLRFFGTTRRIRVVSGSPFWCTYRYFVPETGTSRTHQLVDGVGEVGQSLGSHIRTCWCLRLVVLVGRFLLLDVGTGKSLFVSQVGLRGKLSSQVNHQSGLVSHVGRHGNLESRVLHWSGWSCGLGANRTDSNDNRLRRS